MVYGRSANAQKNFGNSGWFRLFTLLLLCDISIVTTMELSLYVKWVFGFVMELEYIDCK